VFDSNQKKWNGSNTAKNVIVRLINVNAKKLTEIQFETILNTLALGHRLKTWNGSQAEMQDIYKQFKEKTKCKCNTGSEPSTKCL
jgi:hypothetical protein